MKHKSKYLAVAVVLLITMLVVVLCACNDDEEDSTPQVTSYVIQYTDDTGTYTIDVNKGEPYSMSTLPVREGYDFIGLYDLEYGGTQYINAKGASLAPFSDGKNLVLFPQYKAKEYTLILDYQGAPATGMREMAVSYNTRISNLPTDVSIENKVLSVGLPSPIGADCKSRTNTASSPKTALFPQVGSICRIKTVLFICTRVSKVKCTS